MDYAKRNGTAADEAEIKLRGLESRAPGFLSELADLDGVPAWRSRYRELRILFNEICDKRIEFDETGHADTDVLKDIEVRMETLVDVLRDALTDTARLLERVRSYYEMRNIPEAACIPRGLSADFPLDGLSRIVRDLYAHWMDEIRMCVDWFGGRHAVSIPQTYIHALLKAVEEKQDRIDMDHYTEAYDYFVEEHPVFMRFQDAVRSGEYPRTLA